MDVRHQRLFEIPSTDSLIEIFRCKYPTGWKKAPKEKKAIKETKLAQAKQTPSFWILFFCVWTLAFQKEKMRFLLLLSVFSLATATTSTLRRLRHRPIVLLADEDNDSSSDSQQQREQGQHADMDSMEFFARLLQTDASSMAPVAPAPTAESGLPPADMAPVPSPPPVPSKSLSELLASRSDTLSIFTTALNTSGLLESLSTDQFYTILAPSNTAFTSLGQETVSRLIQPSHSAHLEQVLFLHVIPGRKLSPNFHMPSGGATFPTLLSDTGVDGSEVTASMDGDVLEFKGPINTAGSDKAMVLENDNVIFYVVNQVLMPTGLSKSTYEVLSSFEEGSVVFRLLLDLLVKAGLDTMLNDNSNQLTLLAPTNAAFEKLDPTVIEAIGKDSTLLERILSYHVLPNAIVPADQLTQVEGLSPSFEAATANGPITINNGSATVTKSNIIASNGIIHAIDTVLIPPNTAIVDTSTKTNAPVASPVVEETLSPVEEVSTDAPVATPVVEETQTPVEEVSTEAPVDSPASQDGTSPPGAGTTVPAGDSLLSLLTDTNSLGLLGQAVKAAGLEVEVAQIDPQTLLAPTNESFEGLGSDLLKKLLSPPWIVHLREILLSHVFNSMVMVSNLKQDAKFINVKGEPITVNVNSSIGTQLALVAGGSSVTLVKGDVEASNGIAHIVHGVLLPPPVTETLITGLQKAGVFSTLLTLLDEADLTSVLNNRTTGFTLLAPPDDAFKLMDAETLQAVRADKTLLQQVLLYHVFPDVVPSGFFGPGAKAPSAMGQNVTVGLIKEKETAILTFNEANLTIPDAVAVNGLFHAISRVLVPPNLAI